jgi:hypothetical protein
MANAGLEEQTGVHVAVLEVFGNAAVELGGDFDGFRRWETKTIVGHRREDGGPGQDLGFPIGSEAFEFGVGFEAQPHHRRPHEGQL